VTSTKYGRGGDTGIHSLRAGGARGRPAPALASSGVHAPASHAGMCLRRHVCGTGHFVSLVLLPVKNPQANLQPWRTVERLKTKGVSLIK
jgi:hypothetical protein